jgi:hypothetical protein
MPHTNPTTRILIAFVILLLSGCHRPSVSVKNPPTPSAAPPASSSTIVLYERLEEIQPFSFSSVLPEKAQIRIDQVTIDGTTAQGITSFPTGEFSWSGTIPPN